jgi:hypothetical protein
VNVHYMSNQQCIGNDGAPRYCETRDINACLKRFESSGRVATCRSPHEHRCVVRICCDLNATDMQDAL